MHIFFLLFCAAGILFTQLIKKNTSQIVLISFFVHISSGIFYFILCFHFFHFSARSTLDYSLERLNVYAYMKNMSMFVCMRLALPARDNKQNKMLNNNNNNNN